MPSQHKQEALQTPGEWMKLFTLDLTLAQLKALWLCGSQKCSLLELYDCSLLVYTLLKRGQGVATVGEYNFITHYAVCMHSLLPLMLLPFHLVGTPPHMEDQHMGGRSTPEMDYGNPMRCVDA